MHPILHLAGWYAASAEEAATFATADEALAAIRDELTAVGPATRGGRSSGG